MLKRVLQRACAPGALLVVGLLGGCYTYPYGYYGSYYGYPGGYYAGGYGYPGYVGSGVLLGGWGWGYHPGLGYGWRGGYGGWRGGYGGWHGGWGGWHGGGGFRGGSLGSHGGVGNPGTWHR